MPMRIAWDSTLILLLLILSALGLMTLYSASDGDMNLVMAQGKRLLLGFVLMLIVAQIPLRLWLKLTPTFYIVVTLLLVAVLVVGVESKGAQRWLNVGIRFQPAELMRLAMPLMMAAYLGRHPLPPNWLHLIVGALITVVPFLLILKQPDLGTGLLVVTSGAAVLFLAGMNAWLIVAMLASGAAAAPLFWTYVMKDYQRQRVLTFLDPSADPLGSGWNITQSKIAIGSGGLYGKGWTEGTQVHLDFLPEGHTDFIFAVFCEEFGFVGAMGLILLYLLIVLRGLVIACSARDNFSRLMAGSLSFTFLVYAVVNLGMVSGLLPVVGLPLPLMSYGGTAVVIVLTSFGLIMAARRGT